MNDPRQNRVLLWYWLLPLAFVVHDAEELVTIPTWVAANRQYLDALARGVGIAGAVDNIPATTTEVACAIGVVLVVFVAVTAGAWHAGGRGGWQSAYGVLLGGFFLHGFTHLGQALYFGGYTPGVVTACVVVIPTSLYLYQLLFAGGLMTWRAAVVGAAIGIVLLVPAVLLALAVGAMVVSR